MPFPRIVPYSIFYSSKGWEMQPLRFFILPKFGKSVFRRFSVFPMLGQPFSSVFCSSQVWEIRFSTFSRLPNLGKVSSADFWFSLAGEIRFLPLASSPPWGKAVFSCFLVFPREGKPFFANFLFSLVRESWFSLNSCFPPWRKAVFRCFLVHRIPTKRDFSCFSLIVGVRGLVFCVFHQSYLYESFFFLLFVDCTPSLNSFSRKMMIYSRIWAVFHENVKSYRLST